MTTRPHDGISCPVCDSFFNVLDLSDKPIFDDTGPRLIVVLSAICGECDTSYKLNCEASNVTLSENSGVMIDPDTNRNEPLRMRQHRVLSRKTRRCDDPFDSARPISWPSNRRKIQTMPECYFTDTRIEEPAGSHMT